MDKRTDADEFALANVRREVAFSLAREGDVEAIASMLARYHTALDTLEKVATLDLPHDLRARVYHDLNAAGRL